MTEADIAQFYEQNKDRAQGRTLDQLRGRSSRSSNAQREQQARAKLVESCGRRAPGVKVMLDPPRYTVADVGTIRARPSHRAGDDRRVLRLPVPVLRARQPDAREGARDLRRQGQDRLQGFPAAEPPEAPKAAEAAHCAGEQRKYWEMHDAMFANQRALQVPALKQTARAIGLDGARSISVSTPASMRRRCAAARSSASRWA